MFSLILIVILWLHTITYCMEQEYNHKNFFTYVSQNNGYFASNLLVDKLVDIDIQDENGDTAIMLIIKNIAASTISFEKEAAYKMLKTLLMFEPNLNISNHNGHTALYLAGDCNDQYTLKKIKKYHQTSEENSLDSDYKQFDREIGPRDFYSQFHAINEDEREEYGNKSKNNDDMRCEEYDTDSDDQAEFETNDIENPSTDTDYNDEAEESKAIDTEDDFSDSDYDDNTSNKNFRAVKSSKSKSQNKKNEAEKSLKPKQHINKQTSKNDIEKPFICTKSGCPSRFSTLRSLGIHTRRVHVKGRPFACKICGTAFKTTISLTQHGAVHLAIKNFACPYKGCKRRFRLKSHLKTHQKTHLNIRPFACPEKGCPAAFKCKSHLTVHLNSVHATSKPYICDHEGCTSRFTTEKYLKIHVQEKHAKNSRSFKCQHNECTAAFNTQKKLNTHQIVHSGQLFICPEPGCEKGFKYKPSLKEHQTKKHNYH